jgi:HEPN domain-containing protein
MANRSKDWLRQAQRDLTHARNALEDGDFEWSCFASQQAAEKAVKAVYEHLHGEGWGHVVSKLLKELPDQSGVTQALLETAMRLDKLYLLPRYPNGFESGAPGDFYTRTEAGAAIADANAIIEFCRRAIS